MRLVGLACVAISAASCFAEDPKWKSLTFFNDSEDKVYIYRTSGMAMYPEGEGPQKLGLGYYPPNGQPSSLKTIGTVHFKFPIEIEWGYDVWDYDARKAGVPAPKGTVQKFEKIEGIKGEKLEESGVLLLVFGRDKKWHLKFLPGDAYIHKTDIEGKYGNVKTFQGTDE